MKRKTLHIKNMVCNRCIKVVREEMEKLNYTIEKIDLGEVVITGRNEKFNQEKINKALEENGFEIIDSRNANIIERIKILVINLIHHRPADSLTDIELSKEIVNEIGLSYQYVSSLFSSKEGITIEKFIIIQKIEKVKELLVYDELTLSEIAYRLGYSSVQHLSNQFKKVTGLTPTYFKSFKKEKRKPLDKIN
jgi:AraC-like DNA-binding protein